MDSQGSMAAESLQESLSKSMSMVVLSEIGDKTFFIAALLAMRHGRSKVFAGSWGALAVMTFLSTAMGWAAPQLIPDHVVHWAAIFLFFMFGFRMCHQAAFWEEPEVSELAEVEAELKDLGIDSQDATGCADGQKDKASAGNGQFASTAAGGSGTVRRRGHVTSASGEGASQDVGGICQEESELPSWTASVKKAVTIVVPPIVLESFVLTFLAEWGDRSQLATIGLAMAGNAYGVCVGGMLGHAVCTGVAVVGGKRLANHINERMVVGAGAFLFIVFGIRAVLEELY